MRCLAHTGLQGIAASVIPRCFRWPFGRVTLYPLRYWWKGKDSNLRTPKRADLQSAAFNHSATLPPTGRPDRQQSSRIIAIFDRLSTGLNATVGKIRRVPLRAGSVGGDGLWSGMLFHPTTGSRHPIMGQMEPRPALAPVRNDWSVDELVEIYETPLLDLIDHAARVHRLYHDPRDIQRASLFSIKTGGCPEDCAYCPQSAHHAEVRLTRDRIMEPATVVAAAAEAKAAGASRFCMGAAWREVRDGAEFDAVLEMVRGVTAIGMESCVTLGMLRPDQARRLAEAGLTAYNHNLDTSPEFYTRIVGTRTYQDRLATLGVVRAAGIKLCCGGIIGMGESNRDRAALIQMLAAQSPHPESVPINALVAVPGTPLAARPPVEALELVRMVATARIAMPQSQVRLSAGRRNLTPEAQVLCFLVGANSIFSGEKLLTTPNAEEDGDVALLRAVGAYP